MFSSKTDALHVLLTLNRSHGASGHTDRGESARALMHPAIDVPWAKAGTGHNCGQRKNEFVDTGTKYGPS